MHPAPPLVLGDLDERHPATAGELRRRDAATPSQRAAKGYGEPAPQLGRVPVEQDVPGVVVAVWAQRLAESVVALGVDGAAPGRPTVRTQRRSTSRRPASSPSAGPVASGGVDRAEAWCRERGEDQRMRADGLGYALVSACCAGIEQLPHVPGVLVGAGRADRRAPVAAAA